MWQITSTTWHLIYCLAQNNCWCLEFAKALSNEHDDEIHVQSVLFEVSHNVQAGGLLNRRQTILRRLQIESATKLNCLIQNKTSNQMSRDNLVSHWRSWSGQVRELSRLSAKGLMFSRINWISTITQLYWCIHPFNHPTFINIHYTEVPHQIRRLKISGHI